MELSVRFLLEPVILMFVFASMMQMPIVTQYVYNEYSKEFNLVYEYMNDSSSCGQAIISATQKTAQDKVQSSVAHFNIGLSFCWTTATVISCLFYGTLSDRIGRRFIILLNCAGSLLDSSLMLLGMVLKLPVYMFYVGIFINGISGAYNGMFMMVYAYLGDITPKEKLPIRIAIMEATGLVSRCVSFYTSGAFIQKYGFIPPQILMVSLYLASTLYVVFILKESLKDVNIEENRKEDKTTKSVESKGQRIKQILRQFHQQPKLLWCVLTKNRPDRRMVYLPVSILTLVSCFTTTFYPVIALYLMNRPFCFPPHEIGNYLGTEMIASAVATLIVVKVFLLYIPRYLVALISPVFGIAGALLLALVKHKDSAYGALGLRAFTLVHIPIFRATLTENVELSEQGSIYSVVTVLETIAMFVGGFIFNFSYSKLNAAGSSQLFFYIPAAALLIPLILTLLFWILLRRPAKKKHNFDLTVISNPNAELPTEICS